MRILIVLVLLFYPFSTSVACVSSSDAHTDHERAKQASYLFDGGGFGVGVAVQFSPGLFLTANHLFSSAPESIKEFSVTKNGHAYPVTVLYQDVTADVAVLRANTDCPCVPLGDGPALPGAQAFTVGSPLLWMKTMEFSGLLITEGRIQEVVRYNDVSRYLTTVFLSEGSSGGGLFARTDGHLTVSGIAVGFPSKASHFEIVRLSRFGLFAHWDDLREATQAVSE